MMENIKMQTATAISRLTPKATKFILDEDGKIVKWWDDEVQPSEEALKAELENITYEMLITDIKTEAGQRINAEVPDYKQTNALADINNLSGKDDLSAEEQATLEKAQDRLACVKFYRDRSDALEERVKQGESLDPSDDALWEA